MSKKILLVVNFGGPRDLTEVASFLEALLTDEDVIRTRLPSWFQKVLFRRIAKKRAPKISVDYAKIGGRSPIFFDTEWMAEVLGERLGLPSLAFHRYLEETHDQFLESFSAMQADEVLVFPLFPQFSYTTIGSIARWFSSRLDTISLRWVPSYYNNEAYIKVLCASIQDFMQGKKIKEEEAVLVFSAHGLPVRYIEEGDVYQKECEASFAATVACFPKSSSLLCYQSQFGRGKWLKPSTIDVSSNPDRYFDRNKKIIFIPLSFSSDHIETLFEIEELYVKPLCAQGVLAYRCPALGRRDDWVEAAAELIQRGPYESNDELIRGSKKRISEGKTRKD